MSEVQLYVYDLSGGLAKALSLQMTGKQIDGIWHTSVVVFGKEIFYGQGISTTAPGRSHHGQPLQIVDYDETAIDEETFNEYLDEIRNHYTADKYHLLDFNCNSFTNDVIGFLTGQSIPAWIRDLPADFLSTPFGQSLRPTIDNMFRRPTPGATPVGTQTPVTSAPRPGISDLLLQSVAQRAAGSGTQPGPPSATSTVAAPVHISTNVASLNPLLGSHKTAIVLFTSANCGPCRMIEPAFEEYAQDKGGPDVAFVKVSLDGMGGQTVAAQYGVRATPTFLFFSNSQKVDELKGADRNELKTKIDLLLYQAFPPHPHMVLSVPSLKKLSTQPILYETVPDMEKLLAKIQTTPSSASLTAVADSIRNKNRKDVTDQAFADFVRSSNELLTVLTPQDSFPLIDLWRLAVLNEGVATRCVVHISGLARVLATVAERLKGLGTSAPKALAVTSLRLLANASANSALFRALMRERSDRSTVTQILVTGLLYGDLSVRKTAATLAFNVSTHLQRSRRQAPTRPDPVEDGDWEVEVVTAVLESLSAESDPDIAHRLVSAFGFMALLSPWYAEQTGPLLEIIEARKTLDSVVRESKELEVQKLARECMALCGSA